MNETNNNTIETVMCEHCYYYNTENWTCQNKQSPNCGKELRCDDGCTEGEDHTL